MANHWYRNPRGNNRTSCTFRGHMESLESRALLAADILMVGDGSNDTINAFDATDGSFQHQFAENSGLSGPRGMLVVGDELLVVNQNVGQPFNGEVLRYDAETGDHLGALVPGTDGNAPFGPRGMVIKDDVLYVADLQEDGPCTTSSCVDGRVRTYNADGSFRGDLNLGSLDLSPSGVTDPDREFNPRGIVIGPDNMIYVSAFNPENLLEGHIVRFDPTTTSVTDVFVDSDTCGCDLHRPEGLVFGPDANGDAVRDLYVTSFRADPNDNDRIMIFSGVNGSVVRDIDLAMPEASGGQRAFAQALLFGPQDRLYVPITGGDASVAGEVRAYDVSDGSHEVIIPNSHMGQPWFLTFGNTDPATLDYVPDSGVDGDFNDDGVRDLSDIDALVAEIASGMNSPNFDLSGDGQVNLVDRDAWLAEAGAINLPSGNAYLLGDANLDGSVDGTDYGIWNSHKFTSNAAWSAGDFNADGLVDGSDHALWNSHQFSSAVRRPAAALPAIRSLEVTGLDESRRDHIFAMLRLAL